LLNLLIYKQFCALQLFINGKRKDAKTLQGKHLVLNDFLEGDNGFIPYH